MSRPQEETRREFLLKLAKGAAFVPPIMATVGVRPVAGQGGGGGGGPGGGGPGGGGGKGGAQAVTTVGTLSPTAGAVTTPAFQLQQQDAQAPWAPQTPGAAPPWSRPPPTQTGR